MFDSVTLDQLRVLVSVAEEGSFSAAARKLHRVQSAISQAMSNLEAQLDVVLWDRSKKRPVLTEHGKVVLASAQRVLSEFDSLRRVTAGMVSGIEPSVSLCVDALFPVPVLTELCQEFARRFPTVNLRVQTETLSAVSERVLSGAATLGVVSPMGAAPGLERRALSAIRMLAVCAKDHPLARLRGRVPTRLLAEHVQIVLSERREAGVPDQAVLSARTWRIGDLSTKHALLVAGLGWGNLPEHLVREDLRHKRLVQIHPEAWGEDEHKLYLSAVYRPDTTFGPAHRFMLSRLGELCVRELAQSSAPKTSRRRG
jgi:DNA-binding transcriptional LysR family regulator